MLYLVNIPQRSLAILKSRTTSSQALLGNHHQHLPLWQIILLGPQTSKLGGLWAAMDPGCGIVYGLGQINFLAGKSFDPYITIADVCIGFSVGQITVSAKAQVISLALDAHRLNPKWSLKSLLEQNHWSGWWR